MTVGGGWKPHPACQFYSYWQKSRLVAFLPKREILFSKIEKNLSFARQNREGMNLERYEYEKDVTRHEYEFYSIGPKGPILKVVRFDLNVTDGVPYFYLSFGDWDEKEKRLNDTIVSNNGDTEKVLGTVANIILDFTEQFPDSLVYAEGSTMARTRRYQMGISKLWNEICAFFDVYGLTVNNSLEPFKKNVNYEAFLIRRKKM